MARKGRKRTRTTPAQRAAARRNLVKARRRRRIAYGVAGASAALSAVGAASSHRQVRRVKYTGNRHVRSERGVGRPLHTPKAVAGQRIKALH